MFEQAKEGLEKSLESGAVKEAEAPVVEKSLDETEKEQPKVLDLDSLERFRFEGREWSPKDLKNAYLMQSDYTNKTKELSEERKYVDNFAIDAAQVLKNPTLIEQFKQVYPKKYVDVLVGQLGDLFKDKKEQGSNDAPSVDPKLASKLQEFDSLKSEFDEIKKANHEKEVQAYMVQVNAICEKMQAKYPLVNERLAINRIEDLVSRGEKITDKHWDDAWKKESDEIQKKFDNHYKEQLKKQNDAHVKGRDVGPGGGTPGQAPVKENFKQATERAIRELSAR